MDGKFKAWWMIVAWGIVLPGQAQVPYPQGAVEVPFYRLVRPAFSPGESLHYEFSWNGLRSAEAEIAVVSDPAAPDQIHFQAQSRTVGLAGMLWKMRDGAETWSSREDLKPSICLLHVREPTFKFDRKVVFDHQLGTATSRKSSSGEERERVLEIRNAYDPLSLLFVVRNLDWKAGDERRFEVVDGEERYLLVLRALAEEQVTGRVGTFQAMKFSPALIRLPRRLQGETPRFFERLRLREAGRPQLIKTVEFWIALDPPRPLLRVRSEAWIGHVDMELIEESNLNPGPGSGRAKAAPDLRKP